MRSSATASPQKNCFHCGATSFRAGPRRGVDVSLTGKRICITGGAGFIGSHLAQRLLDQNEVVVYDNLHRNAIQFAHLDGHPHLTFIKGDVLDLDATTKAIAGCNIVIHCAAIAGVYSVVKSSIRTMEVNLLGTYTVVKAALAANVE